MMKTLNTLELPLNCTALIEASAGTGKTFTMANLYLRLVLGVGCEPLTVEQILVVTFTKAATEELRDRIRKNIKACRTFLQDYDSTQVYDPNDFFFQLRQQIENIGEAILRLKIAEREIDQASIFTIHSFCQKMLFQFAFDSGVRFDLDLKADMSQIFQHLAEETWRELFYPLDLSNTQMIAEKLKDPNTVLNGNEFGNEAYSIKYLKGYLKQVLPELTSEQQQFWGQGIQGYQQAVNDFVAEVKHFWTENRAEILAPIHAELKERNYFKPRVYGKSSLDKWCLAVDEWANSSAQELPKGFERFCITEIQKAYAEDKQFPNEDLYIQNQHYFDCYKTLVNQEAKVYLYQFFTHLRNKIEAYTQTHKDKGFDDLLVELNSALKSTQGKMLAQHIRQQFPFAMIDEFQDTDIQQYEIFSQIFMTEDAPNQGFIMIGDPKQSIYKFRGADIFTYLQAAKQAQEKRTLGKNWRSLPEVVQAVNQLFSFPQQAEFSPFLYEGIDFQAVEAKQTDAQLVGGAHFMCYTQDEFNEQEASEQCAYQIHQQLKAMEAGEFGLFFAEKDQTQPFEAKDIAVLVRSKDQAQLVKNALSKRGIRSVFLSEDRSVFKSDTAQELLWILHACLNPYHQTTLLTALGTGLWGLSATDIFQLKNDENQWDKQVDKFINYQQIWQHQGILPMLHQLFLNEGIINRICANPTARDRRMTDLLHLTELLQNAMMNLENESALVRWYEQQLQNPQKQEDQVLRLESEDDLIKIVTIHSSKGLQYPIVWLPFVGKNNSGSRKSAFFLYRDENDQMRWNFGERDEKTQRLLNKEEFAEDLRLLYVALTRAESQVNLILPKTFGKGWNAMHYLLSNGAFGLDKSYQTEISTQQYLQDKQVCEQVVELLSESPVEMWQPKNQKFAEPQAKEFEGDIVQSGEITSFTALHAYSERQYEFSEFYRENAQDYDRLPEDSVEEFGQDEIDKELSAYQFPKGAKVGRVIHSFFEHCDFQQAVGFEQILAICEQLELGEEWHLPLQQWFENVLTTPLGEPMFALRDLDSSKRLNEWQFYLRLKNKEGLGQLNRLLKSSEGISAKLPELQLPQLEGYVRGFVDCIIQHQDKFYIIDYKSNFLGYFAQDYQETSLQKAMGQHRYDLQYLLYTLALHRYLRSRLGEQYDYDRDFGGVAYLFLRGMNGESHSGVFFDKPCRTLIEGMDELFG